MQTERVHMDGLVDGPLAAQQRPWTLGATWLRMTITHRAGRLSVTAGGVALAVALLASISAFLAASKSTMTARAISNVSVDWQVQAEVGASDIGTLRQSIERSGHVQATELVSFATVEGLELTKDGTTQTTGSARVVGLASSYRTTFPTEIRNLAGVSNGVMLYQQTAANLQAVPGDTITVRLSTGATTPLHVDGIVDLPAADALFQEVGAPVGAQAQAPPDNVVLVPQTVWETILAGQRSTRPDLVTQQIHARTRHDLPADPAAAYAQQTGRSRNLEVQLNGNALVGDNLAATLAAARTDALYAQVLFLFLGTPGAVVAGLLTIAVASAGRERRRREQALLRARGATVAQLTRLGITDAAAAGLLGIVGGLAVASLVGLSVFGTARFGASTASGLKSAGGASLVGLIVSGLAVALPARHDASHATVAAARMIVGRVGAPRWMRWKVDFVLLALAGLVSWATSRNGYKLVLAVEGVPTISVSYWAFAGPALLWIGSGLLTYRVATTVVTTRREFVAALLRPAVGPLAGSIAATLSRQHRAIARAAALVALTVGFAVSTAVFNATYRQQAEVDAVLTNGADVTATVAAGSHVTPALATTIAKVRGVRHVEAIQHRYAYVGADLQDLYGVEPQTIVAAGRLQNAYFAGGTAQQLMARLAAQPDSLLVSAETVKDFQLQLGDRVSLRLQDGRTKQFRSVTFHYAGVAKEFPTAPRDSFLLANASYVAAQTGNDSTGAFLVDTGGRDVTHIAHRVRALVGDRTTVTDVVNSRRVIASSLTSVDLAGLTRVELGFALALAVATTGMTLWLGFHERRRSFTIASALGANRRQLGAFVWAEAAAITLLGGLCGAALGVVLANMLVKVLTHVFDPAPAHLAVPGTYLVWVAASALTATVLAVVLTIRATRRLDLTLLRAT